MTAEPRQSRIAEARRRSAGAKRRLAAAAGASFAAALALAYVSHPGSTGAATTGSANGGGDESTRPAVTFDFGSGSIAPSGGSTPGAGTHAS
jgi:hypothetical protein